MHCIHSGTFFPVKYTLQLVIFFLDAISSLRYHAFLTNLSRRPEPPCDLRIRQLSAQHAINASSDHTEHCRGRSIWIYWTTGPSALA